MADLETIDPAITGDWSYRQGTIKVAEPTLETHAATKLYVDANSAANFWELDGSELQLSTARNIDMQTKKLINVIDPTSNQDSATKKYVDDNIGGAVDSVFTRTGAVVAANNDYTWAQIDMATSDIADITTKSHTSLTDIGVNNHATLDAHLAAANPHSESTDKTGDTFTGSMIFDDGTGESPRVRLINGSDHEAYIACQATSGDLILDTDTGNIELNAAGDIDAKINQIVNVVDPTSNQDAATKKYVDDNVVASPMTTKGDVYTYSTVDARLGVGANGTLITAASGETTGLKWDTLDNLDIVDKTNAQSVGGVKTFSSFPVTPSSAPSTDYQVANKKYVDDNTGAATTVAVGHAAFNPSAETIVFVKTEAHLSNESGTTSTYYASVQLPNGTAVSSAIVHGTTGSWVLYRVSSGGSATSIANASINSADSSISHTVDNTTYAYVFSASLADTQDVYGAEVTVT